ncbi:MAG: hypothetical protein CME62_04155 [Halobacteriovoraceae bacterium]|nr:hypothetical protein [Halobacteriovoraceae bacterium]
MCGSEKEGLGEKRVKLSQINGIPSHQLPYFLLFLPLYFLITIPVKITQVYRLTLDFVCYQAEFLLFSLKDLIQ